MRKLKLIAVPLLIFMFVLGGVLAVGLSSETSALGPPCRFGGHVTIDGAPVPDGTQIKATIDGAVIEWTTTTFTSGAESVYVLDIVEDAPGTAEKDGGVEGDTVHFFVGPSEIPGPDATWTQMTGGFVLHHLDVLSGPPEADFSADPTECVAPLTVEFTDLSTGSPYAWEWNFGDGGTSTDQHPTHTYDVPGVYTVSLTATNMVGSGTETKMDYITVHEPLEAEFSADPTECAAPLTVDFTDLSTGTITGWEWDFGDDGTSTDQHPTHTYNDPGTYTVALTITGHGGTDAETKVDYITVHEPLDADFSADPMECCAPLTVDFTDLSTGTITGWEWDFGDDGTSTDQHPTHTYNDPGTYDVTLTITGHGGTDTETKMGYITAYGPPDAEFSADPTSGSAPLTVVFTDESTGGATAWEWDFGDDGTSTDQHPTHTYNDPGVYTVSLTITAHCGSDVEIKEDYIAVSVLNADFSADPTECVAPLEVDFTDLSTGTITGWEWDFGDDGTSTDQHPTHTYNDPGVYTVSLTITGPDGTDTETKLDYITVHEPLDAEFSADPTECVAPLEVDFTDLSTGTISGWEWDFGDDGTSTDQHPTHTYTDPGSYTVTLTITGHGGSDTETKGGYITVHEPLDADFSADPTECCAPLTVNFTDLSTGTITGWEWDFGDDGTSTDQHPTHTYNDPGTYTVTLTIIGHGGTDTETKGGYITVHEPLDADFSADPTQGDPPLTVNFTDLSAGTITGWEWDFGDGGTSTDQSPTHIYNDPGIYTVSLTITGHGGTDTETKVNYISVGIVEERLYEGWNLVTFKGPTQPVEDAVSSLVDEDALVVVWYFHNDTKDWDMYSPDVPDWVNDLKEMEALMPYWINVLFDILWTY